MNRQILHGYPCRPSLQPRRIWCHQLLPVDLSRGSKNCRKFRLKRLSVEFLWRGVFPALPLDGLSGANATLPIALSVCVAAALRIVAKRCRIGPSCVQKSTWRCPFDWCCLPIKMQQKFSVMHNWRRSIFVLPKTKTLTQVITTATIVILRSDRSTSPQTVEKNIAHKNIWMSELWGQLDRLWPQKIDNLGEVGQNRRLRLSILRCTWYHSLTSFKVENAHNYKHW